MTKENLRNSGWYFYLEFSNDNNESAHHMHLKNSVRDLGNGELLFFQTQSFEGHENNPAKIKSTSRFTNFKVLKSNWAIPSNKNPCMHTFLKFGYDVTPKPLQIHLLIADDDSAMQLANIRNSSTQVANDHFSCLEHLNETSMRNATASTPSASENPSFILLEELDSIP